MPNDQDNPNIQSLTPTEMGATQPSNVRPIQQALGELAHKLERIRAEQRQFRLDHNEQPKSPHKFHH